MKRVPFKGFTGFTTYSSKVLTYGRYKFYVHVVSDTMDAWVESDSTIEIVDVLDSWFYYPDPNATEAIIWDRDNNKGQLLTLKRHDMLNGAYSFYRLPLYDNFIADDTVTLPKVDANAYEDLSSQIFTSVVNNPFVFEASGDNTVGTGSIQGIAANTEPISQGQFGQYPLIVFTTEGIYGTVNNHFLDSIKTDAIPVGFRQDIHKGTAYIRSNVSGEVKDYEIEIQKVDYGSIQKNKGLVLRVVDEELLNLTSGIVQGMSGSPIIQDGKLIGAVTHVFINDPTRGYGIFVENMISH